MFSPAVIRPHQRPGPFVPPIIPVTPWSFIAKTAHASVASGAFTLAQPAGAASGDLLVACIAYRGTPAFTLPAGWALTATQQHIGNTIFDDSSSIASGLMAYIVRGASAPSFAFTRSLGDVAVGTVLCYRNNHAAPFYNGTSITFPSGTSAPTFSGLFTAENNQLLISMVASARPASISAFDAELGATTGSGTATESTVAPVNNTWRQRDNESISTGGGVALGVADAVMVTAGSTGDVSAAVNKFARHVMILGTFKGT